MLTMNRLLGSVLEIDSLYQGEIETACPGCSGSNVNSDDIRFSDPPSIF